MSRSVLSSTTGRTPAVFGRRRRQRVQAVEGGQGGGVALQQGDKLPRGGHEGGVEAVFELQDAVFGAEYFLLILLQFLRDVAFGLRQCLLAYPPGGHVVLVGVAHLYVVAEHVVEAYFQARYARGFALALLYLQQIVLARGGDGAQFVELLVHPVGYHARAAGHGGRVGAERAYDAVAQFGTLVEPLPQFAHVALVGVAAGLAQRGHAVERHAQLLHLARPHAAHRHLRDDALQVAHAGQQLFAGGAEVRVAEEVFHPSCRSVISTAERRGKSTQRRSMRAPIGVRVRSMTLSSGRPPSPSGVTSSRLRALKRSMRT